jgi:hypothetical protein
VACSIHKLPSGFIRASVTVRNTTALPRNAIVYGPVFVLIRHVYPLLRPSQVTVTVSHTHTAYIGFIVPRVDPKKPVHLLLRFAPPARPQPILVTDQSTIKSSSWSFLENPLCHIRKA